MLLLFFFNFYYYYYYKHDGEGRLQGKLSEKIELNKINKNYLKK